MPSVAMIDGSRSSRMSDGVEDPGGEPDADEHESAQEQHEPGRSGLQRERGGDDAHRHQRRDRDVEAADEQRVRLADRDEGKRHRREQEVLEVLLGEERRLTHACVRAERQDQRRHQHEWHPARSFMPFAPRLRSRARPRGSRRSPRRSAARRARRRESPRRSSARHHDDAVAESGELERIARLDDDGHAFIRLRA